MNRLARCQVSGVVDWVNAFPAAGCKQLLVHEVINLVGHELNMPIAKSRVDTARVVACRSRKTRRVRVKHRIMAVSVIAYDIDTFLVDDGIARLGSFAHYPYDAHVLLGSKQPGEPRWLSGINRLIRLVAVFREHDRRRRAVSDVGNPRDGRFHSPRGKFVQILKDAVVCRITSCWPDKERG